VSRYSSFRRLWQPPTRPQARYTEPQDDRLQEWEDFYNYNRLHGGLGGHIPYERLKEKTTNPV